MEHVASLRSAVAIAVISFGGLVSFTPVSQARDWYILDYQTGTCVAADTVSPTTPTPEQFHKELRDEGTVDAVNVTKNDGGEVSMITFTFNKDSSDVQLFWFPSTDGCEKVRKSEIANGSITDTNDLK